MTTCRWFLRLAITMSLAPMLGAHCIARTWSNASGQFTIEADLVRLSPDGNSVTLRRKDGEEVVIKLDQLSVVEPEVRPRTCPGGPQPRFGRQPIPDQQGTYAPRRDPDHSQSSPGPLDRYQRIQELSQAQLLRGRRSRLGKQLLSSGFDADKVVLIHDEAARSLQPDKEKIVSQISLVLESAEADDLLLLAFCGHGVRINGKSYLVPFEGELPKSIDDEARLKTLISQDWIYEKLRSCRASMKLFLADACQNRPFKGDRRSVDSAVPVESFGQSLENPPKGVLLLTACAEGEESHEAEAFHHGVYTHFLLEAPGREGRLQPRRRRRR